MTSLTSKLPLVARLFLGLVFTVFGANGFLHFLPQPPMSGPPAEFIGALIASGYLFTLVKATEVIAGLLFLTGRYVPLALAIIAPVVVNIVLFHGVLVGAGMAIPLAVLAAELFLAWAYRDAFRPMLAAKVTPHVSDAETVGTPAHAS